MADRDELKSLTQISWESTPSTRQTAKFLTAVAIGATLSLLSSLTMTGSVITLIIVTPILVLFSPILVPAMIVIFLAGTGFLVAGGFGAAAMAILIWIYNYVTGKQPPGSETLDYASSRLAGMARDAKERTKEYGQHGQQRTLEITEGS